MMHATEPVEDMRHAAFSAKIHAEQAVRELGRGMELVEEADVREVEELADDLRDSLQEAADVLHEALGEVERFL